MQLSWNDKFSTVNSVINRACLSSETFCKFCFKNPHLLIIKGECWKMVITRRPVRNFQLTLLEAVQVEILSVSLTRRESPQFGSIVQSNLFQKLSYQVVVITVFNGRSVSPCSSNFQIAYKQKKHFCKSVEHRNTETVTQSRGTQGEEEQLKLKLLCM